MMSSSDLLEHEPREDNSSGSDGSKKLENDKRIYILAILSLFFYIPVGTIMAIFSIIRGNEELDEYRINPDMYSRESFDYVRKGRMIAMVSLILQIISIPLYVGLSIA